jgi:exopolyphosphatase/guanosine-5'-triphosphate,3'-diphosphate pyrophosphatase
MRIAAIDIGSNSTRLLLADIVGGEIDELSRESTVTRLGDNVEATGRLNDAAIDRVRAALATYAAAAEEAGCAVAGGVATSAVREAENGGEFAQSVSDEFGIPIKVIDGDREAQLTFIGAQTAEIAGNRGRSLVVDIGGGSTEFIVGDGRGLDFHVSTQLGAVRQSERHLANDPPTAEQLAALLADAAELIRANVPERYRKGIERAVAVAGTPTVLAAVDQALEVFDPWKVHGYEISETACAAIFERLASLPLEERRGVTGLHPDRAPTIVAGAAILLTTMREFALQRVTVSEHDILYGLGLELAASAVR